LFRFRDGLLLDITGCAHLRGGEFSFLKDIVVRLRTAGYEVRGAMADTVGAAWAVSRYGCEQPIIASGAQAASLAKLPPSSLRISNETAERLRNLGIRTIHDLSKIPRSSLNRRFGQELTLRLCQALGEAPEVLTPKRPVNPYEETLVSSDGISTAEGISHALKILLGLLCVRLKQEGKGARALTLEGHRLDGGIERVAVGTSRPSRSEIHLFKLFEDKLTKIEPALGIETLMLSCGHVEEVTAEQDEILADAHAGDAAFPEMIDRLSNKIGARAMTRYLPNERHWPERSVAPATSMQQKPETVWEAGRIRPIRLLTPPEPVEVTAPVPDYPPMFFLHNGRRHRVRKADGPERIEREWWLDAGDARDYFRVEDEDGGRYWLFRSGPYKDGEAARWFMHGVFA
jgi:protein ImuB